MIASQQGSEAIVKKLIEYGPDINLEDKFGKKAYDRATNQTIFYLLQSAAIDQRIKVSENHVAALAGSAKKPPSANNKSASTSQPARTLRSSLDFGKSSVNLRASSGFPKVPSTEPSAGEEIMEYYKSQFAGQMSKLTEHLSRQVQRRLRTVVEGEAGRSEEFLRGALGGTFNGITQKIKEQIDQHISLKIRLASAKAGINDPSVTTMEGSLKSPPPQMAKSSVTDLKTELSLGQTKSEQQENRSNSKGRGRIGGDKENFKLTECAMSPSKRPEELSIGEVLGENGGLRDSKRSLGLSPSVSRPILPKDKQELYNQLKKQMTLYLGKQLDELTSRVANSVMERLMTMLKKRTDRTEMALRGEIVQSLGTLTQDLRARVDMVITERMTRVNKRMKDRLKEEKDRLRSESVRMWAEEEKHRQSATQLLERSMLEKLNTHKDSLVSGLPHPFRSKHQSAFSLNNRRAPSTTRTNSNRRPRLAADNSVSSLQIAKESPIAQTDSTRHMLHPRTAASENNDEPAEERRPAAKSYYTSIRQLAECGARPVITYEHERSSQETRVAPTGSSTGTPHVEMRQKKGENEEGLKRSPGSGDRLDKLYQQYANVYHKESSGKKTEGNVQGQVAAWGQGETESNRDMPLSRREPSGTMSSALNRGGEPGDSADPSGKQL